MAISTPRPDIPLSQAVQHDNAILSDQLASFYYPMQAQGFYNSMITVHV
jgi:hypothetical protein